jgi:energy-converting hydrogenase Eha subunit H
MPWLTTVTVVGVVVLAALTWLFIRTRSKDQIEEMMAKRRASSKVVSRAEFLEGPNRIPVVLACTEDRRPL